MKEPAEIYQNWLDVVTTAIMENDDETLLAWFGRPVVMRTADAEMLIETDEDLCKDFETLRWGLKTQGVTNYIRLVEKARYLSEDYIEGWHVSHMLRGAIAVVPPYRNRVVLHRDGEIWRCTEADHQLSNGHFPIDLPRVDLNAFEDTWSGPLADIRATHARAEPLYQAFCAELDKSNNTQDTQYWCSLYAFPLSVHLTNIDRRVTDPSDLEAFFDHFQEILTANPGSEFRRTVKYAEFLGADRVVGYHDATIFLGDKILFGPVRSRMILKIHGDAWKCSSVTNSISNREFPGSTLENSDELRTLREINERMRK
jgi:hypothetical protein